MEDSFRCFQRFGDTDRACAAGPALRFIVDRIVIFWC
jgi:hypothetical protein